MLRIDRSQSATQLVDFVGRTHTLTTERIDIRLGGQSARGGLGVSYVRPRSITQGGRVDPILDLVMIVKLVGLLAVAIAAFVREVRR